MSSAYRVIELLGDGKTGDIGGDLSTTGFTAAVVKRLESLLP